jgi:hypothetical protein
MNGALRNKRPALPPTPQQIHDANYDIRYIGEPDPKRARHLQRNPVFQFVDPVEPVHNPAKPKVCDGSDEPTNELLDLSTMI